MVTEDDGESEGCAEKGQAGTDRNRVAIYNHTICSRRQVGHDTEYAAGLKDCGRIETGDTHDAGQTDNADNV